MAIRRRISQEKETGYPLPRFVRYVRRFGEVSAAFLSPKMLVVCGKAEPLKGPGTASISYLSMKAVTEDHAEAVEQGLTHVAEALWEVLRNWPPALGAGDLPSHAFLH